MIKKVFSAFLPFFVVTHFIFSQEIEPKTTWVDSVYQTLSLDEQIAQLFMVAAYSSGNEQHHQVIQQLIERYKIGGLIFMQGSPHRQASLTNRYQHASNVPLLIGMDAEWGLAMRLDSTIRYPKQMALGAIPDDSLIYAMGADIAKQLKTLGVHVNFAPVIDINNNPKNPVIGMRSFGEDKENVARKATAYMKGLQDNGILACAKHFPGHGDTNKDSHETLPVLKHSKERLIDTELYPFNNLIKAGVKGIMTGHLQVNSFDDKLPASLSPKVTTQLLQSTLGYKDLIFSDALNMKAVANTYKSVELEALKAGNDILLFSQDVPGAIKAIKKAVRRGEIKKNDLELHVKKVLGAKYDVGLSRTTRVLTDNLTRKLNRPESKALQLKLRESSITVVNNEEATLPIDILDNRYFAFIDLGSAEVLGHYLDKYAFINHINPESWSEEKLRGYDYVIVGADQQPDDEIMSMLRALDRKTKVIICYFGSPYELTSYDTFKTLLCTYQNDSLSQLVAAEAVFGAISARGKLPVTVSPDLPLGKGIQTSRLTRLAYSNPEAVNMDARKLDYIDEIVHEAITSQATPGCQVLVARKGKVIFEKAYGYYSYDSLKPVTDHTLYDIASITKVMASMQAFMFLEEHGMVDLDKKISIYLPELKGTNKESMTFRDILSHQAGLWPYVPFWKQTLDDTAYRKEFYLEELNPGYPNQVSAGLYASSILEDSVWQWVKASKLRDKVAKKPYDYKYSDMGYYIVQRLIEKIANQPMEEFLQQNFYDPMGLASTSYLPLCKHPLEMIAPTEKDNYFRKTLVYGMVHDQGAALLGGVAGHAGLFSNANDLAKILHMHLNDGKYGSQYYFKPGTIEKFTSQQYHSSRRAVGWDRPLTGEWFGPTSEYASPKTFGHTGFTGTAIWADPEFDLIFVFLSNRIHPDADNTKLIKNNIRTRIQDIIYESIWSYQRYAENLN